MLLSIAFLSNQMLLLEDSNFHPESLTCSTKFTGDFNIDTKSKAGRNIKNFATFHKKKVLCHFYKSTILLR